MKVVILCGGKGTRIRGVNDDLPKPMIPIGKYPILWHIMAGYAAYGHKDFILCLGYKSETIKSFFLNYRAYTQNFSINFANDGEVVFVDKSGDIDWKVTLVDTETESLTGTRIKKIESYIGDDDNFMLTYGDGIGDIDLGKLEAFHSSHGKLMTLSGVRPPSRFGELECVDGSHITEFNEKPQAREGRISGGFFVCRKELFGYLCPDKNEMLEEAPMRAIASDGQMMMYAHDGFWQCMDTARDYAYLNQLYDEGRAPWIKW